MKGKNNRLLAILLAASMVLTAAGPAWAEEGGQAAPAAVESTDNGAGTQAPAGTGQSAPAPAPQAVEAPAAPQTVQEPQITPESQTVQEPQETPAATPEETGGSGENAGQAGNPETPDVTSGSETQTEEDAAATEKAADGEAGKKTSGESGKSGKDTSDSKSVKDLTLLQIVDGAETALPGDHVISVALAEGKTVQLKALTDPADASVGSMQWNSSDTTVASVAAIGGHMAVVTPAAPGQTTVTVTIPGSSCMAEAVIRVTGEEKKEASAATGTKNSGKAAAASGGEAALKEAAGGEDSGKAEEETKDPAEAGDSILLADPEEAAVEDLLEMTEAAAAGDAADTVVSSDAYSFAYTGGTNKVTITVSQLVKRGEQYYATICFSSTKYTQLKAGDTVVATTITDHAEAELPVEINTPYVISGYTTAMSNPHWIDYTITITYEEPKEETAKPSDDGKPEEAKTVEVTTSCTSGMYTPVKAVATKQDDGSYAVRLTMKNGTPKIMVFGTPEEGKAHSVDWRKNEGGSPSVFTIPVSALGESVSVSFSKDDGTNWSSSAFTLTIGTETSPTEERDASLADAIIDPAVEQEDPEPEEKTGELTNLGSAGMFKIVSAALEGTGENRVLRIALNSTGYEYLYKGTTADAAVSKASERIQFTVNAAGKYEFLIPVSASDTTFEVAALSKSKNAWYKRTITLDQAAMTISSDATSGEDPVPDNPAEEEPETPVETGKLDVTSSGMFKVVSASLEESGKQKAIRFALNGQGYEYLYKGSTADAAVSKVSARLKYTVNADGKYEFVMPVSADDTTFEVAALSKEKGQWYRRVFTLDLEKMTLVTEAPSDPNPVPDNPAAEEETGKDDTKKDDAKKDTKDDDGAAKGATGGSQTVGGYTFRWSGGSGKVVISCSSVTERDGQTWATIVFSGVGGRSSHYDAVQVGGATYSGANVFTIPVNLNGNTAISARTTAMSQAHWISYTIYVGKAGADGAGAEKSTLSEQTEKLDEKAPDIAGLSYVKEIETKNSDLLKIYQYKDTADAVYALIEVDLRTRTPRENAKASAGAAAASEAEAAGEEQTEEEKEAAAAAELMKQLYENSVVKYLVIPEGTEVPAGLDKEVIIVHQPVEHASIGSPEALARLEEMELLDKVALVNLEEEAITSDAVKAKLADGSIAYGGPADDPDYRALITQKADLLILPSSIFAEGEEMDAVMKNYRHIAARAITLGIPVLIDRSADEQSEAAAAEWYLYYGEIFGAQEKARELYGKAAE